MGSDCPKSCRLTFQDLRTGPITRLKPADHLLTLNDFMKDLNFDRKTETRRANTPSMRKIVSGFCRTAMDDYRRAGYPFGKTMEGMLVWFEYGQFTSDN